MDTEDKIAVGVALTVLFTIGGVGYSLSTRPEIRFHPGDHVVKKDNPTNKMVVMDVSRQPRVKYMSEEGEFSYDIDQDKLEYWMGEELIDLDGHMLKPKEHKGFKEGDIVKFKLDRWFAREMVIGWFPKGDAACCAWEDQYGHIQAKDFDLDLLEKVE